jgi:hypothetical protein
MSPAIETIQAFVAPVVMISANGLLCLAFYNRLSAVVNRCRTINRERFELIARLAAAEPAASSPEAAHHESRAEVLDELGHQLFDRAKLLRDALVYLMISVLSMLACSLALGLSSLGAAFAWAALTFFVLGALAMMLGVVKAIRELRITLDPLALEHEWLESPPETPTQALTQAEE